MLEQQADHPDNYSCELVGQMCRGLPTHIGGLLVISSYHYWKHHLSPLSLLPRTTY